MKVLFTLLLTTSFSIGAMASGGSDSHGVPTVVYYQAINVFLIVIAGIYFGRSKVAQFFKQKRSQFLMDQNKAQSALQQAQELNDQVKRRIEKLRITQTEVLAKAAIDALELKRQMIANAKLSAQRMQDEAQQMAKLQIEKAKKELRIQLIADAIEISKRDLTSKATSADQKKLQEDFISKVQVVQ